MHRFAVVASGSEDEDDNDNKSDKSDDDNDQDAKVKGQNRDGSLPPPEGQGPSQPKSEEQPDEQQQQKKKKKKQSRQDLDAEYEAKIAELPLRIEPVGLDRHYRKYWLLSGNDIIKSHNVMLPSGCTLPQILLMNETVGLSLHHCQTGCWYWQTGFACNSLALHNNVRLYK